MISSATLIREIEAMEDIQREITAISRRSDQERKHDLIRLRRQLAEQLGRVSAEGEKVFGPGDPGIAAEFRSRLSTMRSAIAIHQANWPAVRLDDVDEDFVRSKLAAQTARIAFIAWTRETLDSFARDRAGR